MKAFIIFGDGDFADYVWYMLTRMLNRKVVAFTVDRQFLKNTEKRGLPVVPFEQLVDIYPSEQYSMALGFLGDDLMQIREERFKVCLKKGYELENIIAPSVINHSQEMGIGNIIGEGSLLEPFSSLGSGNVLFGNSQLGHHVKMGDFNLLASNAVPTGMSQIKNHCYIGANSIIGNGMTVEDFTFVGANANVTDNTEPYEMIAPPRGTSIKKKSLQFMKVYQWRSQR